MWSRQTACSLWTELLIHSQILFRMKSSSGRHLKSFQFRFLTENYYNFKPINLVGEGELLVVT